MNRCKNTSLLSRHCVPIMLWLLLMAWASVADAQYFSKRYPLYAQSNGYISSIQIADDTIYAMCYVGDSAIPSYLIASFDRFDKYGNCLSKTPFSIPNRTNIDVSFNTLIRTNDGGFAYGGNTQGSSQTQNAIIIIKYDRHGNFQWYKEIPDSNYSSFYCTGIIQDSLSNYFLAGSYSYINNQDVHIYLAKTDSLGNLIYKKEFLHPNFWNSVSGIAFNKKGHLVLGGDALSYNSIDLSTAKSYMEIYELDSAGNQLNYILSTDTNGPSASNMIVCEDGGYLVANSYYCYRSTNELKWFGCIAKLDSNFHELWRIDNGPCSQFTQFYTHTKCPDGNYIAVGEWHEEDTLTNHINGWIVKYSESGQIIWNRQYREETSYTTNGDENVLATIGFLSDGSIMCASEAFNYDDTTRPAQMGWLLHLDTAGCLPDSNSCGIVNGVADIAQASGSVRAYPNPASGQIVIEVVLGEPSGYRLYISDLLGQPVAERTVVKQSAPQTIDVSGWQSGLYFYRVVSASGFERTGRFVVNGGQ